VLGVRKPAEAAPLDAAFPEPPSEKDVVIVLNTATASPETSVLALRWFLENAEARHGYILCNQIIHSFIV
jgi:hypothetical protein